MRIKKANDSKAKSPLSSSTYNNTTTTTPQKSSSSTTTTTTTTSHSGELNKAVLAQLSILTTTLNDKTWSITTDQIHSLINTYPEVYPKFLRRLITTLGVEISLNSSYSNSITSKLIKFELNYITNNKPNYLTYLISSLTENNSEILKLFNLDQFFNYFSLSDYQKLIICLAFEKFIYNSNNKKNQQLIDIYNNLTDYYLKSLPGFVDWLENFKLTKQRKDNTEEKDNNTNDEDDEEELIFATFLNLFLNSNIFSFPQKIIIIGHIINKFSLNENNFQSRDSTTTTETNTKFSKIDKEIQDFYISIRTMKFKQTLIEIGINKLNPDKILSDLLIIQKQNNNLDEAFSILYSEILFPTCQKLSGQSSGNNQSSLTPNSISDATLIGLKLSEINKNLDLIPNWLNKLIYF
ncbi:unnamed protein product [[Candida] boidinii]|nr:unnamed protein product [[Candida] boidinii]